MPSALLINKFVPPDEAPTAVLLGDVGEVLRNAGFEVTYLGGADEYRQQEVSLLQRAGRELALHWRLLSRGFSAGRPDLIIALTSPPGLILSAVLIGLRHRTPVFQWCMDAFPEVAAALGVIRADGLRHRLLQSLLHAAYRRCHRVVALDADMKSILDRAGIDCLVQPPWPPLSLMRAVERAATALEQVADGATKHDRASESSGGPYWLYSGNLGRVHEWETLLRAQRILEEKGSPLRLVCQGGGAERGRAQAMADMLGLRRCEWRGYLAPEEFASSLFGAAALAVTQRPETEGLLHPSKLVPLRLIPRPLVWVGSTGGEIARSLRERPGTCLVSPGDAEAVAGFLVANARTPDRSSAGLAAEMRDFLREAGDLRRAGLQRWAQWCRECCLFFVLCSSCFVPGSFQISGSDPASPQDLSAPAGITKVEDCRDSENG